MRPLYRVGSAFQIHPKTIVYVKLNLCNNSTSVIEQAEVTMKFLISVWSLLFYFSAVPAFADYQVSYQELEKFQLVEFSGELMLAIAHPQIDSVLAQIHGQKNLVLKVGLSHGGVVGRFEWFIQALKDRCYSQKGSHCDFTTVFTARCASACTRFPLLSDHSVSFPKARFGFHRTWFLSPNLPIQSKSDLAESYVRHGGSPEWFEANREKLSRSQENFYWMSKKDEMESGLIDQQLKSWPEFMDSYPSTIL